MTTRFKALLALIACVLFWGFSFISIKITVVFLPPMTLGAVRFVCALIFLFFIKEKLSPGEKLAFSDIPFLAGAGLTGVTIYFFCENNGIALVTASEASIIVAAIPVITLGAEELFPAGGRRGKRPLAALRWAGAVISIAGVCLVAKVSFAFSGNILGYLYMAGACVSWVAYSFLTRPLFVRKSRIHIVFWQSVFGFLGFLPFLVFEYPLWKMPDPAAWGHVIFLGICCSALGYWCYAHSLEVLGLAVSSIFINFIPVVTAIGGFFILGDRLSPLQWAGGVLVLTGVYLAIMEPKPAKRR
jgi:drug/metabolite transporter (DMT)-like permease